MASHAKSLVEPGGPLDPGRSTPQAKAAPEPAAPRTAPVLRLIATPSPAPANESFDDSCRKLLELADLDSRLRAPQAQGPHPEHPALSLMRERIRRALPGMLVLLYDAVDRSGHRPAVAQAHDGACGVCHTRLSHEAPRQLEAFASLEFCPHCFRLVCRA